MSLVKRLQKNPKENILSPMELPGSARAKSHSLEESHQHPPPLRALLQWRSCCKISSHCLILGISSCPSVAAAVPNPGSNSLSTAGAPTQPHNTPGMGCLGRNPPGQQGPLCQLPAGVTELADPSRLHQTASSTGCSAGSRAVITRLPSPSLLTAQPGTALPGSVSSCCEPKSSPTCPGAVGQLLTQHMSPVLSQGHTSPRQHRCPRRAQPLGPSKQPMALVAVPAPAGERTELQQRGCQVPERPSQQGFHRSHEGWDAAACGDSLQLPGSPWTAATESTCLGSSGNLISVKRMER